MSIRHERDQSFLAPVPAKKKLGLGPGPAEKVLVLGPGPGQKKKFVPGTGTTLPISSVDIQNIKML